MSLRSWIQLPHAYYLRGEIFARKLARCEHELLLECDGQQDLEETGLLRSLIARGLVCVLDSPAPHPIDDRFCANWHFPRLNWMITGKCNLNCLHCFNAADNAKLQAEFSWEQCLSLLEQAERCGVHAFTITGGEPLMHPRFLDIVRSIYARGMMVDELNTNGYFLTQELLDELDRIGCRPLMKISFDGVGHHDWLRDRVGAEKRALDAARLCLSNDFPVMAQINIHRRNAAAILPTLEHLDGMGLPSARIIRTSESPRWLENAGDACLGIEEYYETCLGIAAEYIAKPRRMSVSIWQFLDIFAESRTYRMRPVVGCAGEDNADQPVCGANRSLVAIAASGEVLPCNQMSGYFANKGISLGNVKSESLQQILLDSPYLETVLTTVSRVREHDGSCRACEHWELCLGGCRALAMGLKGHELAADPAKCAYFRGGWMRRTASAMDGFAVTSNAPASLYQ